MSTLLGVGVTTGGWDAGLEVLVAGVMAHTLKAPLQFPRYLHNASQRVECLNKLRQLSTIIIILCAHQCHWLSTTYYLR